MTSVPSMLSLVASGLYGAVALACLAAVAAALCFRQMPGHVWTWLLLALFFGVLIALRLASAEEWLRAALRDCLRESGHYGDRRSLQALLVAAILVIAGTGAMLVLHRWARHLRGCRNLARLAGVLGAAAMVFLMALRLASLHLVDALLFGPVKLNWLIDIGASLAVLVAASYYALVVRARP